MTYRAPYLFAIFILLELAVVAVGLAAHNILTVGIGSGLVALGMSAYIVISKRAEIPEEKKPLIVDFVY